MRATIRKKGERTSETDFEPWVKKELDDIDRQVQRKRVAKIRELRLMTIENTASIDILKQKKEIKELTAGATSLSSVDSEALTKVLATDPDFQKTWLSYTDEQRNTILMDIQRMKMKGTDAVAQMLLMRRLQPNNTSNVKDMVELINVVRPPSKGDESKNIIEAIRLGFEMASKNQPTGSRDSVFKETMEILKPIYDTLNTKDQKFYNQQFEWLKGQISSPGEMIKSVSDSARALGYQRSGDSNILMEIEKMKMSQDRWQFEESWKREDARENRDVQRESEARRMKTLEIIGTKWMDKASPIIDAGITAAQKRITAPPTNPVQFVVPKDNTLPCSNCGTMIPIEGNPDSITCPKCKYVFSKQTLK